MHFMLRLRPTHQRTRAGCQTCKKRRKRCDETRPVCRSCATLNLECRYGMPLKWASTRDPFIEQSKSLTLQLTIHPPGDFSSSRPAEPPSDAGGELRQVLKSIGATPKLQHIIFSALSSRDQEILLKFLTSGFHTLASNFKLYTEFFTFFNRCEQSFAALWSCITYQVSIDEDYSVLFDEYYHNCLILFQKEISELQGKESHHRHHALWFVGIFLGGICINRLLPWTIHVSAMITILESTEDLENVDPADEELRGILTMLGCFELSACILNRKTKYHRLWARYCMGQAGIDDESGVPCSLLDLLAQLDDNPDIVHALLKWQMPPGELAQTYSWDATRYAAILRALDNAKTKETPETDVAPFSLSRSISPNSLVQSTLALIRQCLEHIPPELSHFKQTVIFPLVMVASQRSVLLSDANAKEFICSTLQNLSLDGCSYYRQGLLKIIQEHWKNDAETIQETARRLDVELAIW